MTAMMERRDDETVEELVARIQGRVDYMVQNPPWMPLSMLFKLIWYAYQGRRVKRFELGPPYRIHFE